MGDQKFTCGRYRNRTFAEIAKSDSNFCEEVLKSATCNKYYPVEFRNYLVSLNRPSISESNVTSFVKKWDAAMEAEFRRIIGAPAIAIDRLHPQAAVFPNGDLGVFIRYFTKKCIFNEQNKNSDNYHINVFAAIFPFKVDKLAAASPATLPVMRLYDREFYAAIEQFLADHFDERYDVRAQIALFLANVFRFRVAHFDEVSVRKLGNVVEDAQDADRSIFTAVYVNDYMRKFPRLSQAGVARYTAFRQSYNSLCVAFGRETLGDQRRRHIRMLPEVTCHELLSLLELDCYVQRRAQYVEWFTKYLFFFNYAVRCEGDNPVFFVDDPLYECLKGYAEYRRSRAAAESDSVQPFVWLMTLVHRRTQETDPKKRRSHFDVDVQNLRHIREFVRNFPGVESAVVDYTQPTNLLLLGIPIVTEDRLLNVFYSTVERSSLADFYEVIIRALMYPAAQIKKGVIYNAYSGVQTTVDIPLAAKERVLDFVRKYNEYDPTRHTPVEAMFTDSLEYYFERETIQWQTKYPQKPNPVPVLQL